MKTTTDFTIKAYRNPTSSVALFVPAADLDALSRFRMDLDTADDFTCQLLCAVGYGVDGPGPVPDFDAHTSVEVLATDGTLRVELAGGQVLPETQYYVVVLTELAARRFANELHAATMDLHAALHPPATLAA